MIKLIVFDIDGTLTPGDVHLNAEGGEEKHFNVVDGLGFRLAQEMGIHLAIISGRKSKGVEVRMLVLPADNVMLAVHDKASALRNLQQRLCITIEETAFVGDDLNDLPAFEVAGTRIAVANAARELKRRANYITGRSGGFGAGREAIEWVLRQHNNYSGSMTKYLERELTNG